MTLSERTVIPRNGLPERRNYAYRGTGTDQGPHLTPEDLKPYEGSAEEWLPDFARGTSKRSQQPEGGGQR